MKLQAIPNRITIKHFHLFCGLGGGAAGFNKGHARVGSMEATFRCIGGIDNDPAAIRDFDRLAGAHGTVLDLFSRDQFQAFHGAEPPADWREATPADLRVAAGGEFPNIVFLSAPCKGFSGLLSQAKSTTNKYQALNGLTLRGIWLTLEAFANDPPEMFIFENVPRIQNRGRALLDQIVALLRHYGYAVAETTHDCGELGGLAESRKRFLLVARHQAKVPAFLYEPDRKPLLPVGAVLGRMPLPGDPAAGPMHRVPRLQWKTWVRLAFVEAGSDWRSLNRLDVIDGVLRDYLIVPEYHHGYLGVNAWDEPAGVVAGNSRATNGKFSVADPRFEASAHWHDGQALGVRKWTEPTGTVAGQQGPLQGAYSVADPRPPARELFGKYAVTRWDRNTGTVIGGDDSGAYAVADPRPGIKRGKGDHYLTAAQYGVVPWGSPCGAVSSNGRYDNGPFSVADPRMPSAAEKLVAVIRALDNTWHRPFTTFELATLQGLVDPDEQLELDGLSDSAWRERIGNAVPPPSAQAIASVMGEAILLARAGEAFRLSHQPIWVRPIAAAIAVASLSGPQYAQEEA